MLLSRLILLLLCFSVHAEPIELVVYGAPGAPADMVTRKVQALLNPYLDTVVINKPGAGHIIAFQYIKQSNKPTVFLSDITLIRDKKNEGYPEGIVDEIKPIYFMGEFNNLLFVRANVNNYDEIKSKQEVKIGYGGKGTFSEEGMLELCKEMNCLPVPYKSSPYGMIDVMNGVIDAFPLVSFGAEALLKNPKLKVVKETKTKNWTMLFSKNLSKSDENTIINMLSKQNQGFYTDLGLIYSNRNPQQVWDQAKDK